MVCWMGLAIYPDVHHVMCSVCSVLRWCGCSERKYSCAQELVYIPANIWRRTGYAPVLPSTECSPRLRHFNVGMAYLNKCVLIEGDFALVCRRYEMGCQVVPTMPQVMIPCRIYPYMPSRQMTFNVISTSEFECWSNIEMRSFLKVARTSGFRHWNNNRIWT